LPAELNPASPRPVPSSDHPVRPVKGAGNGDREPAAVSPKGVSVSHRPDAIRICLDRPPVNAFTVEMLRYITMVIADARTDPRPMLITGSPRIFSAGFDVKHPAPDTQAVNAAARECVTAVQQHPGPTVAAVEGAAVGLGLLIAASADILVVSRTAQLRMPEVALGIVSDVQPLRRFLPDPWIRRLCLLGEAFSAEQLHVESAGAAVCEPGTAQDQAEEVIAAMNGVDATALRQVKQQLYE
jgi:enoyl-CoA hydratase